MLGIRARSLREGFVAATLSGRSDRRRSASRAGERGDYSFVWIRWNQQRGGFAKAYLMS